MTPDIDTSAETDTLLALAIVEGHSSGALTSLADSQPRFVAELQSVHKIMATLGALGAAGDAAAPPPCETWGPFALKEQVGRGAFGVVCRAFDPAVARDIAVKLYAGEELPPEPRLMARVRHPNVVTVFGAAVHDRKPGIWMEFVHGRTLAERVQSQGPLPVEEAVRIGIQLCSALAAVHEAHLVHGDIKPRNVMEQDDGRIVLMDFGAGSARGRGDAPSRTVSGTPLYMAPEVVLGKSQSAQSDIYSLGVLIYYALTGTYPTYAADWKELRALHARRQEEADVRRVAAMLRELRPEVSRGLARCVAKAIAPVRRRYATAEEFRSAFEAVQQRNARSWPRLRLPQVGAGVWAALLIALTIGGGIGAWLRRSAPPAQTLVLKRLTWDDGLTTDPARSIDGKLLAYASDRGTPGDLNIWVQQLAGGAPLQLTSDPADDSQPSFSADGARVAFRSERAGGGIYVVPTLGGEARLLARDGYMPRFSPDGRWIAYFGRRNVGSLFVASASGDSVRQFKSKATRVVNSVTWSSDSRHLIFIGLGVAEAPDWRVVDVAADGGEGPSRPVGAFAHLAQYDINIESRWPMPWDWVGNRIIFSARLGDTRNLWEIDIAPGSFQLEGAPRRVSVSTEDQFQPSLGPDGSFMFATRTIAPFLWELPLDANLGKPRGEMRPLTPFDPLREMHTLSSDGRRLVFTSLRAGHPMLCTRDLATGVESVVVPASGPPVDAYPVMSGDPSRVLYLTFEGARELIRTVSLDGGIPEQVCENCGRPTGWSPDGRYVILQRGVFGHATLALLDLASGRQSDFLADPDAHLFRGHFSPDGRWVTFHWARVDGPVRELIAPFRGMATVPPSEWIAVTDGSILTDSPRWSPDGNLLYFISDADGSSCIWAQALDPATKKPRGAAFAVQHVHGRKYSISDLDMRGADLSVAEGRLVYNMGELTGNIWMGTLR